jgi:putative ABC transport system substrate-binding protein
MQRRDFITLLGSAAAAWPLAAQAQQPALPAVGWLSGRSPDVEGLRAAAFRKGLGEIGYIEGRSVAIESHWAYGQPDRLPALAADLLRRQVSVIIVAGAALADIQAVRALDPSIPIVFSTAADPVQAGMVASLNRPTGNITGVSNLGAEVGPKRLEVLHELVPQVSSIAYLSTMAGDNALFSQDMQAAAQTLGLTLHALKANSEHEIEAAFAALHQIGAGAIAIEVAPLFTTQVKQLADLALRHRMAATYQLRDFAATGGLMSYGGDPAESYRLAGTYVGRILKGEKPADLPIVRSTKIELVINMKTAKVLGLTVPITLLGRADEVIE